VDGDIDSDYYVVDRAIGSVAMANWEPISEQKNVMFARPYGRFVEGLPTTEFIHKYGALRR
jgi:hypothetical protein